MDDIDNSKEFKAKLDDDDILEELGLNDRAVLDSEGIFDDTAVSEQEEKKQEPPKEKKADQDAAAKPSEPEPNPPLLTSFSSFFSKLIPFSIRLPLPFNKLKALPLTNIALAAGIAFVFFIISVFVLDYYFTKRSETEYKDFLGSIKEAVSTGLTGQSEDIESIMLGTFLVPVLDMEKGKSFLRASFLVNIKEVDSEMIENNIIEIRKAIYKYIRNIDPGDVSNDKKRKLIGIEIKKIINTTIKKQAVHDIVIEELTVT